MDKAELIQEIEKAVSKLKFAVSIDDSKEIVDWAVTVHLRTAQLAAKVVDRIREVDY